MDTESIAIHAVEEMEKAPKVPANHDQGWLQAPGGTCHLGQNEQVAVGPKERGSLRNEP